VQGEHSQLKQAVDGRRYMRELGSTQSFSPLQVIANEMKQSIAII